MLIQLENDGASIRITLGLQAMLLLKQAIKGVSLVREDIIKITTGGNISDVFFRQGSVSVPASDTALELIGVLNTWIADCVCYGGSVTPTPA